MRTPCPRCDATYEIPDARLAPGRAVRCARCAETWVPVPMAEPVPGPVPVPVPVPVAAPIAALPAPEAVVETLPVEAAEAAMETRWEGPPAVPFPAIAEPPAPEPVASAPPAPSAMADGADLPEDAVTAAPRSRAPALVAAWVLSAVVLAGAGWALVSQRQAIVAAWPPSERLFVGLGLLPRP